MGGYGVHRRVMGHMGIYGAQESVADMGHRGAMGHIGVLWGVGTCGIHMGLQGTEDLRSTEGNCGGQRSMGAQRSRGH